MNSTWNRINVSLCLALFAAPGTIAARLLCPWDSSGKNTRMVCHFFLQAIFLTQGSNSDLLPGPAPSGGISGSHGNRLTP